METILFIIIIVMAFFGAVAIANSTKSENNEKELKDEEKTPCTIEDYTYKLKLKK